MPRMFPSLFAVPALLTVVGATNPNGKTLSLEWIALDSHKTVGMSPSNVHWSEDSQRIYFNWNPDKKEDSELFWIPAQGGEPQRVPEEERWRLPEGRGDRNKQGTHTVYAKFGDIFLMDVGSGEVKRILRTARGESNPRFLADGGRFTFESDNQLFLYDVASGATSQLTDIRSGSDPDKKKPGTDEEKFLEEQQRDLFDVIKKRKEDEERREARDKAQNPRPDPYYLGSKSKSVVDLEPSPDGKLVAIVVRDSAAEDKGRLPIMPKYVTDSGFVEADAIRRGNFRRFKVGAPVDSYRVGLYDVGQGTVAWSEVDFEGREINHNRPVWAEDSSKFAFVIGSVDHKDRWIAVHDVAAGKTEIVDQERDEAWIRDLRAGRGGSAMGWLPDNDTLWYLSERHKWWHLYTCEVSTKQVRPLTQGEWEIDDLRLSQDKATFYLTTSAVHPAQRQLYSLPASGGQLTRLTQAKGWSDPALSPDEKRFALSFQTGNQPSEVFLLENRSAAEMRQLTRSTSEEFQSLELPAPLLVTFPDQHGNQIHGEVYLPPETPASPPPAVLYIHGAGYAQRVYERWYHERLLHHYMTRQGYVVLSVDYRGSAGYGRDCRTDIYRHMGGKDVDSSLAAIDYLVERHGVDRARIGVYGGSYGGFYTLMALFQHPGVFKAGVAVVPVTDWAHYNHGYTARILNNPQDDDEAYRRSSPIYLAEGLQDNLLIVDGIEDDNVLVQDTIRLSQRLIELKKENWSVHLYPVEGHGWRQESSKLDYYRRLTGFFDSHLKGSASVE